MGKLLKYEFRKTWMVKLILLGLTAVAEIVFLLGLWLDRENMVGTGVLLLSMMAFGGIMAIGLYSLLVLHRDMNTKQSYMLFMTPNSSYRILGAKVLENGLSMLLTGAVYLALAALDVTLLFAKEGNLEALWKTVSDFLRQVDQRLVIDGPSVAALGATMLTGWFAFVTLTYLADVISAALLNGRKMNGLITFALIIALEALLNWVLQAGIGSLKDISLVSMFLIESGINLVFAVGMYVLTAWIMDRHLSV